ncbi:hypothetical protein [Nocardioides sp. TF02-7]|uniref:hypothetical protein n=1 Tax=Nocardioides sp. TF02-7 TaxID=2917724 RepID=UPI001F053189|nr:hypothetical protein [Nocardioides sp. TF02-7]UMG91350.1 hypothetical protein MF408_14420 [Nocardioides sp. TF02-7]
MLRSRRLAVLGPPLVLATLLTGCSTPSEPADRSSDGPGTRPSTVPLEPGTCPRLGVYEDWSPDADLEVVRQFGAPPQVGTSYYQPDQPVLVGEESERIRRGTSPNITFTTKGTDRIEVLAAGPRHPDYPTVEAWLADRLADLAALTEVDRSVPVYATLEHEFRAKVRTGQVTGRSADPVVYGRALDRFYALAAEQAPRLRTTYWIVGYDREFEGLVGDQFRTLPDTVVFDPYADEPGETLTAVAAEDVAWIRQQQWYDGQELALGEFGMTVELGDAAVARFLTDVPDQLTALGISWAVLFNRERDFDTRIGDRSDGRAFPRARAAFARALRESRRC